MGIDWFTFGAQIINFLILVALLRKFLYGPIVRAMDERQAAIAAKIAEADQRQDEAIREAETFRQKNEALDRRQQEMLAEVRSVVDERREELMQEARQSVDHNRAAWHAALEREQRSLLQEVRRDTGMRAVGIARQALNEFASRELHEQIVDVFLRRLLETSDQQRSELREALAQDDGRVIVTSAFPLPGDAESRIRDVLEQQLHIDSSISFRESDDLMCGIEVRVGGHQLSWSFDDFLDSVGLQFERDITSQQPAPS